MFLILFNCKRLKYNYLSKNPLLSFAFFFKKLTPGILLRMATLTYGKQVLRF